jgi:hypothetical protein
VAIPPLKTRPRIKRHTPDPVAGVEGTSVTLLHARLRVHYIRAVRRMIDLAEEQPGALKENDLLLAALEIRGALEDLKEAGCEKPRITIFKPDGESKK